MSFIRDWHGRKVRLGIATDHGGFELKRTLVEHLRTREDVALCDVGPFALDPCDDYTDYACSLARRVSTGELDCGILICRSGIGMSIAANRFHGVRAALAHDPEAATVSRSHNASNVLVIGAEADAGKRIVEIAEAWLASPFSGDERHVRRLAKIETLSCDDTAPIRHVDPEIAEAIDSENARQAGGIELIASENFASVAVRAASGSVMTNKYAEGYPGKRYYNGCEFVDDAESLAIERACTLFGAEAANVQPHSGSQANMAVYFALLEPGDTVLAMSLDHGGHLTHGLKVNFSGRLFNFVGYGVDPQTETLNYDTIATMAAEHKPRLIMAGASAYPRIIDFARLRQIADSIGAYLVVDMAHIAGLVAAGLHPSPVPHADVVTSTTHKTLRGPRAGLVLSRKDHIKAINSQIFPGIQGGPLMHVIAAKAICFREAMTPEFKVYQQQVIDNAMFLASELEKAGFRIVSGGTDNHLMLVDLRPKSVTGKRAATALDEAAITVNKNLIPFDPESPFVTSGLRVGTPAVTTRGMKETEMATIAGWIGRVVDNVADERVAREVRDEVLELTTHFPLPQFQC